MVPYQIQRAQQSDLELAAGLFNQYRMFYGKESDVLSARQFLKDRLDHEESVIFLITGDSSEEGMGFAQLYSSFSSLSMKKIWILNDLFIAPPYRKRGLGKQMLQKIHEFCKASGAAGITLETGIQNLSAQGLYEKSGYIKNEAYFSYGCYFEG